MSIRQVIWNFELNPSKGSGVIKIPKKFPFWGGEGFRAKKNFVLSSVDQMVTAYQFWSQSAQKSGHTQTDRHSIALRDRINEYSTHVSKNKKNMLPTLFLMTLINN